MVLQFDANVQHLNDAATLSYQLQTELMVNKTQIDLVRDNCIRSTNNAHRTQFDVATNDYTACLINIKNQRVMGAKAGKNSLVSKLRLN